MAGWPFSAPPELLRNLVCPRPSFPGRERVKKMLMDSFDIPVVLLEICNLWSLTTGSYDSSPTVEHP